MDIVLPFIVTGHVLYTSIFGEAACVQFGPDDAALKNQTTLQSNSRKCCVSNQHYAGKKSIRKRPKIIIKKCRKHNVTLTKYYIRTSQYNRTAVSKEKTRTNRCQEHVSHAQQSNNYWSKKGYGGMKLVPTLAMPSSIALRPIRAYRHFMRSKLIVKEIARKNNIYSIYIGYCMWMRDSS